MPYNPTGRGGMWELGKAKNDQTPDVFTDVGPDSAIPVFHYNFGLYYQYIDIYSLRLT